MGLNSDQVAGCDVDAVFATGAAAQIASLLDACSATGREQRASDLDIAEPGILPVDVVISPARDGAGLQMRLEETAATETAIGGLLASLYRPDDPVSASALFVNDLNKGLMRCLSNNLTPKFGLPNSFRPEQLHALRDPADTSRTDAFIERRARLDDQQYLTSDRRFRTPSGEWRIVASRARVLERNADGSPAKMLGVMTDVTSFHTVAEALQRTVAALGTAEVQERARLGRDLHDSLSQELVGAELILNPLRRSSGLSDAEKDALDQATTAIRAALQAVRTFSFLLHPPKLESLGLVGALRSLVEGVRGRTDLVIDYHAPATIPRQSDRAEFALFQVAQEALTNT